MTQKGRCAVRFSGGTLQENKKGLQEKQIPVAVFYRLERAS